MPHYKNFSLDKHEQNINYLKKYFGEDCSNVDEMNLIMFSTSGVHGNYTTIEEIEYSIKNKLTEYDDDYCKYITILIIRPRIVSMIYGNIHVETLEDIKYLKKLRSTSKRVFNKNN